MNSNNKSFESVSKQAHKPMWKKAAKQSSSREQTQPDRQSLRTRFSILRLNKNRRILRSKHHKNHEATCTSTVHSSVDEEVCANSSISDSNNKTGHSIIHHGNLPYNSVMLGTLRAVDCLHAVIRAPDWETSYVKAEENSAAAPEAVDSKSGRQSSKRTRDESSIQCSYAKRTKAEENSAAAPEAVDSESGRQSSKRTRDESSTQCSYAKRTKASDGSARMVARAGSENLLTQEALENNIPPQAVAMNTNGEEISRTITMPVYPDPIGTEVSYPKTEANDTTDSTVAQIAARAGSQYVYSSRHEAPENIIPAYQEDAAVNVNSEIKESTTMPVYLDPVATEANCPKTEEYDTMDSAANEIARRVARAWSDNSSTYEALGNKISAFPEPVAIKTSSISSETVTVPVCSELVGTKANYPKSEENDTMDNSVVYLGQRWVPEPPLLDVGGGGASSQRTLDAPSPDGPSTKRTKADDESSRTVGYKISENTQTERECWQADLNAVQEQFSNRGLLGSGGFGFVSKAKDAATGQMVVLKWQRDGEMARKECLNMSTFLRHPNIVQTMGILQGTYGWFLVTEFDGGHDLRSEVKRNGLYSDTECRDTLVQVLRAVGGLHEANIIHRDIKPHNIVTCSDEHDEDAAIKLIDFGLSCTLRPGYSKRVRAGTSHYMAPEVISGSGYNSKADMYSVGCTGYYLLKGKNFVDEGTATDWDGLKEQTVEFLHNLTSTDPARRMSAKEALAHRWMAM